MSRKCGGYSDPIVVGPEYLAVWKETLQKYPDLEAKGEPTTVQIAAVSGFKYMFAFNNGSTVTVWVSWRNVLKVTEVTHPVLRLH